MTRRVAVFIDAGDQYFRINKKFHTARLNYEKYIAAAEKFGILSHKFAYGTQIGDNAINFITALKHLGFDTNYASIEKEVWYHWDAGISLDIARLCGKVDTIVLGSSSRHMAHAISWAKEHGVYVVIIACGICSELRAVANECIEITKEMLEGAEDYANDADTA